MKEELPQRSTYQSFRGRLVFSKAGGKQIFADQLHEPVDGTEANVSTTWFLAKEIGWALGLDFNPEATTQRVKMRCMR